MLNKLEYKKTFLIERIFFLLPILPLGLLQIIKKTLFLSSLIQSEILPNLKLNNYHYN